MLLVFRLDVDERDMDPVKDGDDELLWAHDRETNESSRPNNGRVEKWCIEYWINQSFGGQFGTKVNKRK